MERALCKAQTAETLEKYEDVVSSMKEFIEQGGDIHEAQKRNLLSVGYKNTVGVHRNAWRSICSLEASDKTDKELEKEILKEYKEQAVKEIVRICTDAVGLISDKLLPGAQSTECKVFYHKMKGDYYRYMAEVVQGDDNKEKKEKAKEAYQEAVTISEELGKTDPIRLGLALNFSVFYYEILDDSEEACKLAKKAFDDGIDELDSLSSTSAYKDSTLILQLLRDNLNLWTSSSDDKEDEEAS